MESLLRVISVLKEEGVNSFFNKIKSRVRYLFLREIIFSKKEKKKWKNIKNKYKGKRVFLIGNGPSLNKTPLYLLKDEYTMCFNRFYIMNERLNWHPSFYLVVDHIVLNDIINDMDNVIENSEYCFFPYIHYEGDRFYKKIKKSDNIYWLKQYYGRGFSLDLPKVFPGGSVIFEGMQVLKHLGFDEIYLVGVDMSFKIHKTAKHFSKNNNEIISQKNDDPNHFDPRYFGVNRKYHQPEENVVNNIVNNLRLLSEEIKKYDIKIINAGYDSNLTCFPVVDFKSLFDFSGEKLKNIFTSLLIENTSFISLEEFELNAKYINNINDWQDEIDYYYCAENVGIKLIGKSIFTHIPIGPYDNKYYFKKRN